MLVETAGPVVNDVIENLPGEEQSRLLAACEPVELTFGNVLCTAGVAEEFAYFPLDGFVSLVSAVSGHRPMEVALIGSEGVLGSTQVLAMDSAPLTAIVQGAGTALRIPAQILRQQIKDGPLLRQALQACVHRLLAQVAQNIACTRFHEIDARLARWLLMTHDRAHADHFHLTHEYLAGMLGVQRGAVSIAAAILKKRRLISYARGEISILSRRGLESIACECYRLSNPGRPVAAQER